MLKSNLKIRNIIAVLIGNLILGIGVGLLKVSAMGNDPYTACNIAISDAIGMWLGTYQLLVNLVIFGIQLKWGRKYIGFGTVINLFLLGYIVQFSVKGWQQLLVNSESYSFLQRIIVMLIALVILTFGLSMYQVANLGVSPYDYLALGMTDKLKSPYFVNRIITDGACVLIIIVAFFVGSLSWADCNLGVGTIICVFCLGPLVGAFDNINRKWIGREENK